VEVASHLFKRLGSVPLLYGSLGLSLHIGDSVEVSDIDILIEQAIYDASAHRLPRLMRELDLELVDAHEQEYSRGGMRVGIASDGDMVRFAGIDPSTLATKGAPCRHRLLTLEQYLHVYTASQHDGYRQGARAKGDERKLALIRRSLGIGL
jgi:hypothetical protein